MGLFKSRLATIVCPFVNHKLKRIRCSGFSRNKRHGVVRRPVGQVAHDRGGRVRDPQEEANPVEPVSPDPGYSSGPWKERQQEGLAAVRRLRQPLDIIDGKTTLILIAPLKHCSLR